MTARTAPFSLSRLRERAGVRARWRAPHWNHQGTKAPRKNSRARSTHSLLGALVPWWFILAAPAARAADLPRLVIDLALDPAAHRVSVEVRSADALTQPPELDPGAGLRLESPKHAGPDAALVYSVDAPSLAEALPRGTVSFIDPAGTLLFGGDWAPRTEGGAYAYELRVSAPASQRVAASGRLVEERVANGRYVARYEYDHPGRDLSLAAGPLIAGDTQAGDAKTGAVRVRTLFPPDLAKTLGASYRAKAAAYLERYARQIGPYPGGIFQIVSTPAPVGLGFPTFTAIGRQILPLSFVPDRSLGHEILHAWWGHGVAVDYAHGSWSEALTTFMADYAFAEEKDATAARDMRYRWLADFAVLPPSELMPVTSFREKRHTASQAIGYDKGAMVFLMLRDALGTETFENGIRRFWQDWRFRRASWQSIEASFEAAGGGDLGGFFAQWLERPDAPRLRLADAAASGSEVAFTLTQDEPAYRLRVPVVVRTVDGAETRTVELDSRERRFTLKLPAPARALSVDPEYRIFRRLSPGEIAPTIRSLVVAEHPAAVPLDAAAAGAARTALARFFEGGGEVKDAAAAVAAKRPLLLIGTRAEVEGALERWGLPARPSLPACTGPGCVWAGRYAGGVPLAAVEAATPEAAERLVAVMRHYGAESWLAWDGTRVGARGLATPPSDPLTVRLRP
jgi:aminopeptidase N